MNESTSKGCLLIQNSYETSGCKSAKDKELVCRSDRTFLTSHHESAQDLESGLCLIYCPYKTKQKSSLYLVLLPYSSLASCLSGHLEGFKSIPPYIWMTEVIVCTVRVELHWLHHIEFFSFFPFFSPPGRLSPIISTLHVCKAWAPWGILCPLHPLLCWGLCSSWHLAPPVQPLCRCLYSQLPCPCPWPLLQPVCQPALYSRYNLRPIRPRRKNQKSNHAHSAQLIYLSVHFLSFLNSKRPLLTLQILRSHQALWPCCCVHRSIYSGGLFAPH